MLFLWKWTIFGLALGSCSSAHPMLNVLVRTIEKPTVLTERATIQRRDLATDICGGEGTLRSADENRNPATWRKYNMGDWYREQVKPYVVSDWQNGFHDPPIYFPSIQDINLRWMDYDGISTCHFVGDAGCSPNGRDFPKCTENPEAHFLYFAFFNWNQYLQSIIDSFDVSTTSLTALTSTLRLEFFVPRADPTRLLVPVNIVGGIAGAIAGFYGPVAIVAGAGSIASAFIIQAQLDRVDETVQWGAVQSAIGSAFTQIVNSTEGFFNHTMLNLPETKDNPITYDVDPTQTPTLFYEGAMGGPLTVGLLNNGIYGALAASAINALWASDGIFIMKISDKSYDDGSGTKACDAYPEMTICNNDPGLEGTPYAGPGDTAYIWIRQAMTGALAVGEGGIAWSILDKENMFVWGAYARGMGAEGAQNANNLQTYGLSLVDMTISALKTFDENGFPFENQNGATIESLRKNPIDITLTSLLHISMPICDIDAVLNGKKLTKGKYDDPPIVRYGPCTCAQYEKWPALVDGEESMYTPDVGGYPPDQCQEESWKDQ